MVRLLVPVVLAVVLVACGNGRSETTDSTSPSRTDAVSASPVSDPASPTALSEDFASGEPALWIADSLESLLSWHPHVAIATVSELVRIEETTIGGVRGPPTEIYALNIEQVLASDILAPGQTIYYRHGDLGEGGPPPSLGPPSVGSRYLFFLSDMVSVPGSDDFVGAPFARFPVTADGKIVPNGWEGTPGIAAISGINADQAQQAVATGDPGSELAKLATRSVDEIATLISQTASRVTPRPASPE